MAFPLILMGMGCSRSDPPPLQIESDTVVVQPKVELKNFESTTLCKPLDVLRFEGIVDVAGGAWVPGAIVIKIEEGKANHGSISQRPSRRGESTVFEFQVELKAPRTPGVYTVHAVAIGPLVKGGPNTQGNSPPVSLTAQSKLYRLEVR